MVRKEVQFDQVRRISIDNLDGTRHIEGVNLDFSLDRGAANMSSFRKQFRSTWKIRDAEEKKDEGQLYIPIKTAG
tara:strand:- start:8283 stop:8507 length:225 start_codon:yes stop_codon:yes gene_type:complete